MIKACSIDGCEKKSNARGWCKAHWSRWARNGNPLASKKRVYKPGKSRCFVNEIALKSNDDNCLIWPYARDRYGYGVMCIEHTKRVFVSRVICEIVNGPPPTKAHQSAHSCGNGHLGCCNPRHLSWKTRKENMEDMEKHGTRYRGDDNVSSKVTSEDVLYIRSVAGLITQKQLAYEFGIDQSSISNIVTRKNWRHI
jgi:hypothetical protein